MSKKKKNEELGEPKKYWFFGVQGAAGYFILKYLFFRATNEDYSNKLVLRVSNILLLMQWSMIVLLLVVFVIQF